MDKPRTAFKRRLSSRRFRKQQDQDTESLERENQKLQLGKDRLGAFYAAEPPIRLSVTQDKENPEKKDAEPLKGEEKAEKEDRAGTPVSVHGKQQVKETVKASGKVIRLEGRTDGEFDGGSYETKKTKMTQAKGCENCADDDCIRVTGILAAKYHVAIAVTLPSVSDYPDLTPCQQKRVRNAINNVLAPHEQQHVAAFKTYNGVTSRPFDLTLCRSEFESTIRSMFEEEERTRRDAAKTASDALDPFFFDVDLECEDKK